VSIDHQDVQDRLRSAGMRVTAPRVAVFKAMHEAGGHFDAEAVARVARERLGALSTQAVYDILRVMEAAGLVRRIQPAGSASLFELRVGDNHHHLVCRVCGSVQDVDCVVGERPCLEPSDTHGFVLDEAEVTFWGLCPQCQGQS
jgi:Fur family transcriptional regulator, stress-responsive regulator